jgi:hypothetical protein
MKFITLRLREEIMRGLLVDLLDSSTSLDFIDSFTVFPQASRRALASAFSQASHPAAVCRTRTRRFSSLDTLEPSITYVLSTLPFCPSRVNCC